MSKINFILFHKGHTLPVYLYDSIKQIEQTQTDYNLYLITNAVVNKNCKATIINLNDIVNDELQNVQLYKSHQDPLWRTSFERFFYIKTVIQQYNMQDIIHFDNDVLIYVNAQHIINYLRSNILHNGLPTHKPNEYVCGFMYIKDFYSISLLCSELLSITRKSEKNLELEFNSMAHEMRLLGCIKKRNEHLITSLPILPFNEYSDLYTVFNGVFDPSSYGQYFGWTESTQRNTVHPADVNRYIDKHIVNKNIVPIFNSEQKKPYLLYNEAYVPIFNLHIHSKNLIDFR